MTSMKVSLTQPPDDAVQINIYIYALIAIHRMLFQCFEHHEPPQKKGERKGKVNDVGEGWRGTLKLSFKILFSNLITNILYHIFKSRLNVQYGNVLIVSSVEKWTRAISVHSYYFKIYNYSNRHRFLIARSVNYKNKS